MSCCFVLLRPRPTAYEISWIARPLSRRSAPSQTCKKRLNSRRTMRCSAGGHSIGVAGRTPYRSFRLPWETCLSYSYPAPKTRGNGKTFLTRAGSISYFLHSASLRLFRYWCRQWNRRKRAGGTATSSAQSEPAELKETRKMLSFCLHHERTTPRRDAEGEYERCLSCGARIPWGWEHSHPVSFRRLERPQASWSKTLLVLKHSAAATARH